MNHPKSPNGLIDASYYGELCPCGSPKKRNYAFCFDCFNLLRQDAKDELAIGDLYKHSQEQFYEAYEAAVRWLKEVGEIRER